MSQPGQPRYKYYSCDVITGNLGVELPLVKVQATRSLNSPGAFQGSLDLAGVRNQDGTKNVALQQAYWLGTEEDRCSIAVTRDGTLIGEWRITARSNVKNDGSPIQITGEWISGYLAEVIPSWTGLSGDLPAGGYPGPNSTPVAAGTDPLQIAYDLVAQAKDPITSTTAPAGSRGFAITLPARAGLNSGQLVTQTDWATQTQNVLAMMTTLQQAYDFDWDVDVALVGLTIVRTLTLSYPERGIDAGITILMPEQGGQGGQITDYEANRDGSRRFTQIITTGSSANAGSTLTTRSNNTSLVAGYPLKQTVYAQSSTTDPTQLQMQSDAKAAYATSSEIPPVIVILADTNPVLGSYTVGDTFTVDVGQSDNFPYGVSEKVRIIGIQITPPVAGDELVTLTVALP